MTRHSETVWKIFSFRPKDFVKDVLRVEIRLRGLRYEWENRDRCNRAFPFFRSLDYL